MDDDQGEAQPISVLSRRRIANTSGGTPATA